MQRRQVGNICGMIALVVGKAAEHCFTSRGEGGCAGLRRSSLLRYGFSVPGAPPSSHDNHGSPRDDPHRREAKMVQSFAIGGAGWNMSLLSAPTATGPRKPVVKPDSA